MANRNFGLLFSGRTISVLGDFFGATALSVIVYQLTGSALGLGLSWTLFLIPRSGVRLVAGVYVDRWNRRYIMITTETVRGLLFGGLAVANKVGVLQLWMVLAVSFFVGLLGALFDLSNDALLPSIVERDSLIKANSLMSGSVQAATVLGWGLAGISIAMYGVNVALVVDSLSFFALVFAISLIPQSSIEKQNPHQRSWSTEFSEGLNFFKKRTELLWLSIYFAVINFFVGPFWYVYLLPFSEKVIRAGITGYGILNSVESVGLMAASFIMSSIGRVRRRRLYVIGSMLAYGLTVSVFAFSDNLVTAIVAIFLVGLTVPFGDVVTTSFYQEVVPNEMRGRVFGVRYFIAYVTIPVGVLLGGFLADQFTVAEATFISGLAIMIFVLFNIFVPSLKRLDGS